MHEVIPKAFETSRFKYANVGKFQAVRGMGRIEKDNTNWNALKFSNSPYLQFLVVMSAVPIDNILYWSKSVNFWTVKRSNVGLKQEIAKYLFVLAGDLGKA